MFKTKIKKLLAKKPFYSRRELKNKLGVHDTSKGFILSKELHLLEEKGILRVKIIGGFKPKEIIIATYAKHNRGKA